MKIKDLGEFGLIEHLRRKLSTSNHQPSTVFKGIGDDTAVIKTSGAKHLLWTTDIMIENVHFFHPSHLQKLCTLYPVLRTLPFMLGWKALAINLSDIASMGGIPKYALVTLGLTGKEDVKFIDELYDGMRAVGSRRLQPAQNAVQIVGGDTTRSPVLVIDVTVIGEVEKKNLLPRSAAKPGDIICVTGCCGDSAAGFEIVKNVVRRPHSVSRAAGCINNERRATSDEYYLISRHLMPTPRLKEARVLTKNNFVNAMIDSSDGLMVSVDLLCKASGFGAKMYGSKIPVSKQLNNVAKNLNQHVSRFYFSGGEDYELVFTVPKNKLSKVLSLVPKKTGTKITAIGEITDTKEISVIGVSGKKIPVSKLGFDHFKR